jgi:uncharacterized protein YhaN
MHLEKIREREVLLGVLQKRLQEAEDQISELMEQAGVGDEESFREKSESHRRCQVLEQELRVLISGLVTGLCFRDEAQMTRFMGSVDWKECHKSSSDLRDRLADLRKESESLANLSGRLSREIESLEAEEETESLLQERERLRAKLNKLTGGWTTFKIALLLLEKTLNMYEREKQPSVLEKSSRILGEITRGAYVKILFPLDGDQVKVLRSDQSLVDERLLSRATLEQVCLSLKLAHLEVYGPDESIPVVVDDILVNFDCERAARTAQLLADFSERARTQVLFFTCHPHIAGLFPPTVSKITLEPLIRGDGPSWQWRSIDQVTRPV